MIFPFYPKNEKGNKPSRGNKRTTATNVINVPTAQSRPKSLIMFDSATIKEAKPAAVVKADSIHGRPSFFIEDVIASLRLKPTSSSL